MRCSQWEKKGRQISSQFIEALVGNFDFALMKTLSLFTLFVPLAHLLRAFAGSFSFQGSQSL